MTTILAILVTYNPENYQFSQYALALNDETQEAVLTIKRTITLPALNSSLTIGRSKIESILGEFAREHNFSQEQGF